ncbi:MAG: hypothetical protein ACK5HL_03215 [Bacilli bacterium]
MYEDGYDKTDMNTFFRRNKRNIIKFSVLGIILLIILVVVIIMFFNEETIRIGTTIKNDLKCYKEVNGKKEYLYECYYEGNVDNNYLWYGGFLYRILSVNEDGSVKIISDIPLTNIGYYTGKSNVYEDSYVKSWLDTHFYNKLKLPESFLTNGEFCYGNETNECEKTGKNKVGLISYSEYEKTGGKNGFLANNIPFWTLTESSENTTNTWYVSEDNTLKNDANTSKYKAIYPVINLHQNLSLVEGTTGTKDNPYIISGDTYATSKYYLSTRYSGEYVKFAGRVWRIIDPKIMRSNKVFTKLILNKKDVIMPFSENNSNYYRTSNKKAISAFNYLNDSYMSLLESFIENSNLYFGTGPFYLGEFSEGNPYTNISSNNKYGSITGKLGLPTVSELFSSNDLNITNAPIFTLSPVGEDKVWATNKFEPVSAKEEGYIRPVIYLSNLTYIIPSAQRDGRTPDTAYEIGINTVK